MTTAGKGNHSVMSEKWHYITYSEGTEELYNLEKDPMEWKNLASEKTLELDQVKAELRAFLPVNEVDSLPQSKEEKSKKCAKDTTASRKAPDPTIKPQRKISDLK